MVSLIFLLVFAGFSTLFSYLLGGFALAPLSVLIWVIGLFLGFVASFSILLSFMIVYGRLHKEADSFNMRHHRIAVGIMRLVLRLVRLKIRVTGREHIPAPGEAFVVVGNHQSNYDILASKAQLGKHPLIFIAKQEIFTWPIVGNFTRLLGNIPIDRTSPRSSAEAIVQGIRALKKGQPVVIFPEGTRSKSNEMGEFKAGSFKLAMKSKTPILPMTIYNMHKAWRGWPFLRQNVYIHFHPPIWPKDYTNLTSQALSNKTKRVIQSKIDEFGG